MIRRDIANFVKKLVRRVRAKILLAWPRVRGQADEEGFPRFLLIWAPGLRRRWVKRGSDPH
jgi:hypothetical protein